MSSTRIETGSLIETKVQLSNSEEPSTGPQGKPGGLQSLMEEGNVVTVEGSKVTIDKPSTTTPKEAFQSARGKDSILSTARAKNSVVPVNDERSLIQNPSEYLITVSGVEMTVQSGLDAGLLAISGSGELIEANSVQDITSPPEPTQEQIEESVPLKVFTKDGQEYFDMLAADVGKNSADQCIMGMLGCVSRVEEYDSLDDCLEACGSKLREFKPGIPPDYATRIAGSMIEGMYEAVGLNAKMVDSNLDAERFTDYVNGLRDDQFVSLLLPCIQGSPQGIKNLIKAFYLGNKAA